MASNTLPFHALGMSCLGLGVLLAIMGIAFSVVAAVSVPDELTGGNPWDRFQTFSTMSGDFVLAGVAFGLIGLALMIPGRSAAPPATPGPFPPGEPSATAPTLEPASAPGRPTARRRRA